QERLEEPAYAAAPPPPPATPAPPAEPTPVAPRPPALDEPIFDTHVELDAGPFPDFASLSTFERALPRLPRVDARYVRRLAEDRALIELTLSEPSTLLSAMREALPYEIDVRSSSRGQLVLDVLAHLPAAR